MTLSDKKIKISCEIPEDELAWLFSYMDHMIRSFNDDALEFCEKGEREDAEGCIAFRDLFLILYMYFEPFETQAIKDFVGEKEITIHEIKDD